MTHFLLGGAQTRYITRAPMIVVRLTAGSEAYVKGEGKLLPLDAEPSHVERLLELGLIARQEAS